MNKVEHLLACLSEEAGEVVQIVGKSLRFGLYSVDPVEGITNLEKLRREVHDMLALYTMVCIAEGVSSEADADLLDAKKQKVEKYQLISRQLGLLDNE